MTSRSNSFEVSPVEILSGHGPIHRRIHGDWALPCFFTLFEKAAASDAWLKNQSQRRHVVDLGLEAHLDVLPA